MVLLERIELSTSSCDDGVGGISKLNIFEKADRADRPFSRAER